MRLCVGRELYRHFQALLTPRRCHTTSVLMIRRGLRILRYFPRQLLAGLKDRPLPPPNSREQALIDELRAGLAKPADAARAYEGWTQTEKTLREHALRLDPREFTGWKFIRD